MALNENTGQPQQPPVFVLPQQSKDKLIDYAVKGGLLLLLIWGGKKVIDKIRHNAEENKAGKDPVTQQAMSLRAAMNPSGFEWLRHMDGTNEDAIFNTAKEITDLQAVIKSYRSLYAGDSLMDDLKGEMKSESYKRLLNIFKFKEGAPDASKTKTGLIVVSAAQTNVRKTPRVSGSPTKDKLLIFGRSNIITTVDKGIAIGIATGRTHFDEQAEPSGVQLMEVNILKVNAPVNNSFTAWVAESQVETLTQEQYKTKRSPALSITQDQYDSASSSLNGTDTGADYRKEIVATSPTYVLNDKFQVIGKAERNMILGFPIMELTTPDNVFVKFMTVDDTQRWVNKKHIKAIEK